VRFLLFLLVVVTSVVLSGPAGAAYAAASEIDDRLCAEAPMLPWRSLPKTTPRGTGRVVTQQFRFASWRTSGVPENDVIEGELYEQPGDGSRLVLLIPGMGEDLSTRGPAERLAGSGEFDVVRIRSPLIVFSPEELAGRLSLGRDEFRAFVRRGAETVRTRLCDYERLLAGLEEARGYRYVGVSGVSVGGIFAILLGGLEPARVGGVLVLISGGDIADILLNSEDSDIRHLRDRVFKLCPMTREEARSVLTEEMREVEPLRVASRIDPAKLLMVSNVFDWVIPYRDTEKLWQAAHEPTWKRIVFPPGHYASALLLLPLPLPLFEPRPNGFPCVTLPLPLESTIEHVTLAHFRRTLEEGTAGRLKPPPRCRRSRSQLRSSTVCQLEALRIAAASAPPGPALRDLLRFRRTRARCRRGSASSTAAETRRAGASPSRPDSRSPRRGGSPSR
jgi:pimeloyl-ACP methyl ester carboxylesterase